MAGYAYSSNGLSYRMVEIGWPLDSTEVLFAEAPDATQLEGAFPNYATASSAATLVAAATAALAGTVTLTSTGTAALDGDYPIGSMMQQQIVAEVTSIVLNGTFCDGGTTTLWPDVSGAGHSFDVAHFKAFATAVAAYVAACTKCANGQASSLPSATLTIA